MNLKKYSFLIFFIIISINSFAQRRITEQSLNISYGRNFSMFVKNGYKDDISNNLAFNGEYSFSINNLIRLSTGFQYYENKYSIDHNFTHTNRKLFFINHSRHIAFPLLIGLEYSMDKARISILAGANYQLELNSESKRTLIQDSQIVFEDVSDQINSSMINPMIRLKIEYEVFKAMRLFISADYMKGISEYNFSFVNTNRMNLLNSQIGLSFLVNKHEE